jgi:hypothetical protein
MKNALRQIFVISLSAASGSRYLRSRAAAGAAHAHLRWTVEYVDHHTLRRLRSGLSPVSEYVTGSPRPVTLSDYHVLA